MKYHQEQSSEYRNRAEERRKTVGSTAFVSVRRAAPQPVPIMPVATVPTVIPGKTIEENKPKNNIPESTPSVIGRMLLEKDALMVFDTLYNLEPQRNAKGMFTNHHLNVEKIISTSNMFNVAVYQTTPGKVAKSK